MNRMKYAVAWIGAVILLALAVVIAWGMVFGGGVPDDVRFGY